jgi:hypothetical protein
VSRLSGGSRITAAALEICCGPAGSASSRLRAFRGWLCFDRLKCRRRLPAKNGSAKRARQCRAYRGNSRASEVLPFFVGPIWKTRDHPRSAPGMVSGFETVVKPLCPACLTLSSYHQLDFSEFTAAPMDISGMLALFQRRIPAAFSPAAGRGLTLRLQSRQPATPAFEHGGDHPRLAFSCPWAGRHAAVKTASSFPSHRPVSAIAR